MRRAQRERKATARAMGGEGRPTERRPPERHEEDATTWRTFRSTLSLRRRNKEHGSTARECEREHETSAREAGRMRGEERQAEQRQQQQQRHARVQRIVFSPFAKA